MRILTLLLTFLLAGTVSAQTMPIPGQVSGDYREGDFVWFDLVTSNTVAAKNFYARMFGWEFSESGEYSVIRSDGEYIGSVAYDPELEADGALWISSMSVPDVDAAADAAVNHGGAVLVAPQDVDGRGRMAVLEDPQGAIFSVLRATSGDPAQSRFVTGDWFWVNLLTPDEDAATDFYFKAMGYGRRGDMLLYYSSPRATITESGWVDVPGHWLPMVVVPNVIQATGRVGALGGKIYLAPALDIGNGKVALVADPTGAAFLMQEIGR